MKKTIASVSLAAILGITGIISPANVNAESNDSPISEVETQTVGFTAEDYEKVRENLFGMGIESTVVDSLIEKLKNGESIDADILTTDEAVSQTTETDGNITTTTYIYEDGSRSQETFEEIPMAELPKEVIPVPTISKDGPQRSSLSGGSCSTGSGYTSCTGRKLSQTFATFGFSYYASYQLINGGYDKITSAGKWNIWVAGGYYTNPSMRIIKSTENASGNAEARLSATLITTNSYGTITRSLSLIVGDNTAYSRYNTYY